MALIYAQNAPSFMKGKTAEQKKILKSYFLASGCIGALTGMSDAKYDELVQEKVNALNLRQKALSKIGLDESEVNEIAPVTFSGWDDSGDYAAKIGKDGKYRSSKYQVSWLFFSSTQVYFYSYTIDMIANTKKENTEEYFYKDITNFSTMTSSSEVMEKGKKQTFDVSRFSIVVPGDKLYCAITGSNMEEVERSIQGMKQKLREKKM